MSGFNAAFYIGAALVAAGTAANSYASHREATRAANAADKAAYEQGQYQKQIAQKIKDAAGEYDPEKMFGNQKQEAERITKEIKDNVSESQQLRDEQQATAGNVSNDYLDARAAAQDKNQADLNAFSELMGRLRGTNMARLQNQFGLMDYGQQVSQLARNANGAYTVAQERINNAANSKSGLHNIGTAGSALGSLMMMGAGLAGAGASAAGGAAGQTGTLGAQVTAEAAKNGALASGAVAPLGSTATSTAQAGMSPFGVGGLGSIPFSLAGTAQNAFAPKKNTLASKVI